VEEPSSGPAMNVVSGATVSTMNERVPGVASTLPARSIALTRKVWLPSLRVASVVGELQAAKLEPSTLHWKADPPSVAVNEKVGVESWVEEPSEGPKSIVESVACVSTLKLRVAAAWLPAASVARTRKV